MNPTRKKRLYRVLIVFLFSISGISLILYSLNSNLDYFFTPTELKSVNIPAEKRIKIGGMVLEDSVKRYASEISFIITDYENSINVVFEGIVPDLFKEGSGVVALGFIKNEIFYAEEVLAKHDENYMPPNLDLKNDNLNITFPINIINWTFFLSWKFCPYDRRHILYFKSN